jgi:hypothetical protein
VLHRFDDALLDRGDEAAGDRRPLDLVDELEAAAVGAGFDLDRAVGELAFAAGLSSMLTKTRRARPSSSARCQSRSVCTSTPATPLTTTTAESAARSAAAASATKLGSPGVSIRLISRSACPKQETQALIERPRRCSSGSWSETVEPAATLPSRPIAPAS